jgi:hypothetical protein
MALVTSVEVESFRRFKKLHVDGLARVNLIVGANNSGKTVLLEALEAVVSASPTSFFRASVERGELRRRQEAEEGGTELDVCHWFHGHRLAPGATLRLHATGKRALSVSQTIQPVPDNAQPPFIPGGFRLATNVNGKIHHQALSEDGWLRVGSPSKLGTAGLRLQPAVGFVTTDRLSSRELAPLWAKVVLTPAELHTVDALRLVEPAIERIAMSEGDAASAKVLLRGANGPVPLGTLGEGVSRILGLALHLVHTQGGYLLLDEIENGLHWSVMPKVWRFLVETALARDVQVFATTHSKDWLEGLAQLHRDRPELAEHVSVHRLEAGRETSVRFDASRIAEYVEMELEAR